MMKTRIKYAVRQLLPRSWLQPLLRLKYRGRQLPRAADYVQALKGQCGIEIGGPSLAFQVFIPLYPELAGLDGVNFSEQTTWEGHITEARPFRYGKDRVGKQWIAEASSLPALGNERYDFVISSNCLEHVANPIKALEEWLRIVRPGGHLLLVLPNQASNFDHRRPVTRFEHLLEDHRHGVGEDDLTHLPEILALHDGSRDAGSPSPEAFRERSLKNHENRCLHHHVFDPELMAALCRHLQLELVRSDSSASDHFMLARKPVSTGPQP